MQSTNFEFMREHRSDLADEAAAIERDLYDSPSSAIDLLRTFGQRLLQHLLEATGRPICDPQGNTFGFDELIDKYSKYGNPLQEVQRKQFHKLRVEGNKQHEPRHAPTRQDVQSLLEVAWRLARWVGEQLGWQGIPNTFEPPPEGGHAHLEMQRRLDDERRQTVAALQREAEAKRWDVSGWICDDQRIEPPQDYVGRRFVFDEMKRFLESVDHQVLVIQGQLGKGKTAIIQQFLCRELPAGISEFHFFFRDQKSQAAPDEWVCHLYARLVERFELPLPKPSILQATPAVLVQQLRNRIEEASRKHPEERLLFLLDGVDETGPAEQLVWSFVSGTFPSTVKLIATTRPLHSSLLPNAADKHSPPQVLDLDAPDDRVSHQQDVHKCVDTIMPHLDRSTVDTIVRLSDANFLYMQKICRELRKIAESDMAGLLQELTERKALGEDLGQELDERSWKRLERLPPDQLELIEKLATLLVSVPESLTERMIRATLNLRRADWVSLQKLFFSYVKRSQRFDPVNETPIDVFCLSDPTFAEFVRRKLHDDLAQARARLADYCREQIKKREGSYEYHYAVRFGPKHLSDAQSWHELERLLTELEFVEAKCRLGMIRSLIADYQLASERHPEWRRAFDEEVTRDASLKQWAKDVMLAGRRWRADLDRIRDDNAQDEIELPVPYPFPSPPDTSTLRAQLLQVAQGRPRQLEERVENLQALRAFVTDQAELLARYPAATLALAFNYSGILAEQAEQKDAPWFEERPRPYYDPCAIPLPTLPVDATAFAVSDDGARCVTGESNGDLRFWDLSTGECVAHEVRAHDDEVVRILLSVDGSRVISFGRNGSIEARNFHDRCELWRIPAEQLPDSKLAACSLEASIVAVVTDDDEVRVIDGDTGKVLCELSDSEVEGITQVHVVPERFQVLVEYDEGNLATWDLRIILSLASEDYEPEEELDLSEDDTTEPDEYDLADFWRRGMESADRRVQIGFTGLDADLHIHADGEKTTFYGPEGDGTQLYLIASGRVLWENTRHSGWEILKAQNPGEKLPHVNRIRGWDVLSQWSPREFETIYRELKGGNPTQTMKADPEAGDTGIQCYPVHARREEATQPGRSRSVTPDGQIGIAPHIESPTPILHSIPVPIAESTTTELEVRLSPNGLLALVSVSLNERPAGWFLWDIRTGNRVLASSSDDSTLLDISPDWKFIVVIEANELQVRNLLQADQPLWRLPHSRRAFLTSDGRNMVVYSNSGASVWDITQSEPRRILDCDGAQQVLASPDARFLICSDDEMVQFYDLRPGQQSGKPLLMQPCLNALSGKPGARVEFDGTVIIDDVGEVGKFSPNCDTEDTQVHLMLRNLSHFTENIEPLVTATRVFRYRLDAPELQQLLAEGGPLPSGYELPGEFDAELTIVCPKCGNRFAVPDGVERAIDELLRAAGITPDQSPCISLPDSAWADPALQCQCIHTHCRQSLRLNPFVAFPARANY